MLGEMHELARRDILFKALEGKLPTAYEKDSVVQRIRPAGSYRALRSTVYLNFSFLSQRILKITFAIIEVQQKGSNCTCLTISRCFY